MPQGTIRMFHPEQRTGTLLDDSLVEHAFDEDAFRASGLFELRIGQRVRFELVDDEEGGAPRVTHLNIVTL